MINNALADAHGTMLRMIALNARFDGKVIVPETPLALPANQRLRVQVETIAEPIESAQAARKPKRVLGQQPDLVVYLAPDWDAPLPDDIWEHNQDSQTKP